MAGAPEMGHRRPATVIREPQRIWVRVVLAVALVVAGLAGTEVSVGLVSTASAAASAAGSSGSASAAGLAGSAPARPSPNAPGAGSFSVTPARRYVVARPPVELAPSTLTNTTQSSLRVLVFPVLLTQQPSGAFAFESSAPALAAARAVLSVGPHGFTLAPGASRRVGLHWRGLPPHARFAAVGVVYQATPVHSAGLVRIVEQLLGVNILRRPGHYRQSGRLSGVRVSQIKPGVLRFTLGVGNTGQAVSGPSRLSLTVRRRDGRLMLTRRLASDIVLPGVTRSFVLDLARRLPAGAYIVRGHLAFGSSHKLAAASAFRLVGPNRLPASNLQLGPLVAQGDIGGSAQIRAALRNTGTRAGSTSVELSLYRLTGADAAQQHPIATRLVNVDALAPAHGHQLKADLGRLQAGGYRLLASYEDSTGMPRTLEADFQAHARLGVILSLRRFSVEHALLLPGLLLALFMASIALLLLRERQLKRAPR
jgi:hypothetical protein